MKASYIPILVLYYVEWALKVRQFSVNHIDPNYVTHITYAFANINDNGEVVYGDIYTDLEHVISCSNFQCNQLPPAAPNGGNQHPVEIVARSDSSQLASSRTKINDMSKVMISNTLRGNLGQLFEFKVKNRHIKTCLAIGGWEWSKQFPKIVVDKQKRTTFIKSLLKILNDCGMDGVELDWEFPGTGGAYGQGNPTIDGPGYVTLVKELREEINLQANSGIGPRFFISVAAPCTNYVMASFPIAGLAEYVDHFNLMGYDMSGQWNPTAWHHAPLFGTDKNQDSVDNAVSVFLSNNVPREKIIVGIPEYGRTFGNTNGLDSSFKGVGQRINGKSFEDGTVLTSELSYDDPGFVHYPDKGASTTYLSKTRTLISHDSPESVKQKANYILKNQLGGGMMWESSQDRKSDSGSRCLYRTLAETLWNGSLKSNVPKNCINYPSSRFINVKAHNNKDEL